MREEEFSVGQLLRWLDALGLFSPFVKDTWMQGFGSLDCSELLVGRRVSVV